MSLKPRIVQRKISGSLYGVITTILLLTFVYVYFLSYINYIESEQKITEKHFSEIASAEKNIVLNYLDRMTEEVQYSGQIISILGSERVRLEEFFEKRLSKSKADAGIVILSDGTILYGDPQYSLLFNETVLDSFKYGNSFISNVVSCDDGIDRFAVSSIFSMENGNQAVVMLLYPQNVLNSLIESSSINRNARICIVDSNGRFIANQSLSEPWIEEDQYIVDGDLQNRLMVINSTTDGKEYAAYSKPLGINDWFVVYVMPKVLLDEQKQAGSNRIHFFGTACFIFGLLIIGIGYYKNHVRSYRLKLYKKKFKIATSQSARAAFEYDKRLNRLKLISQCEYIKFPKPHITLSEMINFIHPADRGTYGQSVIELRRQGKMAATIRISHFSGTEAYRWYYVTATRLNVKGEGRALTIGTVEDIDEREKERLSLAEKATTDCLTGLCNRAETEKIINERLQRLEENEHSAFAIIDLDDFKAINDEHGHDIGDKALLFFSEKLKSTFRFGDVIGRLGGDEFVVYMTLTSDRKVVERRINELMESLKMKRADDNFELPEITCSVGCCIADKGDSFETLYKRADIALYESKTCGKGLSTIA